MKLTKLLCGALMLIALNSCKTHKDVEKNSSRKDSTGSTSKEAAKVTSLLQQNKNNRLDGSYANEQNKFRKQTTSYLFAPSDTGNKYNGNIPGLFPNGLEQRLIGITVTTEEGTQATQTGNLTRQSSDVLNVAKDSSKDVEKKSAAVSTAEDAKHSVVTQEAGGIVWWPIILLLTAVVIWKLKGWPIVLLVKWIRKVRKEGMPNTPA